MKAFLEEYGFSILSAIIVILLIMMISPVGTSIKESLGGIITSFTGTANEGLDNASATLSNNLSGIASNQSADSSTQTSCYDNYCQYDLWSYGSPDDEKYYFWITDIDENNESEVEVIYNDGTYRVTGVFY